MQENRALWALGIPFSALVSVIFGMMALSFPVGAYLVYNTEMGGEINYEYPIQGLDLFVAGISVHLPAGFELGDAFAVLWGIYAAVFVAAVLGPQRSLFRDLGSVMNECRPASGSMALAIQWFAILILASVAINIVQESAGITISPPPAGNELVRFFEATKAPLVEEVGFRVILIGIPLYLMYSRMASARHLLASLWHPHAALDIRKRRRVLALIVAAAVLFGMAHIISGEPWSDGKLAQAAASGAILGWVYYRHGLGPALLIHWAANYFLLSYVYLISEINSVGLQEASAHSMMQTFELILVMAGIVSAAMMAVRLIGSRRRRLRGPALP